MQTFKIQPHIALLKLQQFFQIDLESIQKEI